MWLEILRDQVKGRGLGAVAADLEYSKATLSLVLNSKYTSDTSHLEASVLRVFGTVECPFEQTVLEAHACRDWQQRDVPTSSAWDLRHWAACQSCPHNPTHKESQ